MIKGYVSGQALSVVSQLVVSDTIDYLEAQFMFYTPDWTGLSKWVHFTQSDKSYAIMLDSNDCITRDMHLNLTTGVWSVYVHGTSNTGMRITTNITDVEVTETGILEGQPLPDIPPSVAEQVDMKANNAQQIAQSVRDDADAGKFDGPKGDRGERGEAGAQGPRGYSGVFVGDGPAPVGTTVQVRPNGRRAIIPTIVQETGDSTEAVMSQKAVTEALGSFGDKWELIETVVADGNNIIKNKEPDGKQYAFKAMKILGNSEKGNRTHFQFRAENSKGTKVMTLTFYISNTLKAFFIDATQIAGYWSGSCGEGYDSAWNTNVPLPKNSDLKYTVDEFPVITEMRTYSPFTVNSIYEIWAVRA